MRNFLRDYLLQQVASRNNLSAYGFMSSLPDPDKILSENGYDYQILRDLMTDAHLSAVVLQRKTNVMKTGWEISNIADTKLKKEVIDIIADLPLGRIISEMLDVFLYGFQVCEIEWKIEKDRFIPVDIIGKPQEWFIFNNDNEIRLRKRVNGFYIFEEGLPLPDYKFVLLQNNPNYTNPYGEKLLSKVFWSVTFKKASRDFWQLMVEKYGMPYLIGYYSTSATQAEKDELETNIANIVENQGGILPTGTQLDFKENAKYEIGQLYKSILEHYDKEISKAILTVTLSTAIEKAGSYRLAALQKEIMDYIALSDKKKVERAINQVIEFYVKLNYGEVKEVPQIKLKQKEQVIETSAQRDKILQGMGVQFTAEYFKKRYNLKDQDFKLNVRSET